MRIVVLSSSVYSETACAIVSHLCALDYPPLAVLSLRTFDPATILRKVAQWGLRDAVRYAQTRLGPRTPASLHNVYLAPFLSHRGHPVRSLREIAEVPITFCKNQNSEKSLAFLKNCAPDLIVFAGGNILRQPLLDIPRLGVINLHLGLLPDVRGMSAPEWSLLNSVPLGITIHYMDRGIDTGPILLRRELPDPALSSSLENLRNRLIAFGVEQLGPVILGLDRGTISPAPQAVLDRDLQHFVIHQRLRDLAALRLQQLRSSPAPVRVRA